jgi:hypothetical protein
MTEDKLRTEIDALKKLICVILVASPDALAAAEKYKLHLQMNDPRGRFDARTARGPLLVRDAVEEVLNHVDDTKRTLGLT